MAVYFADAVEQFLKDMLEANADNLKAFETKPGVYSNVDPDTHHDVEIPDVHLTKELFHPTTMDKMEGIERIWPDSSRFPQRGQLHCPRFCARKYFWWAILLAEPSLRKRSGTYLLKYLRIPNALRLNG